MKVLCVNNGNPDRPCDQYGVRSSEYKITPLVVGNIYHVKESGYFFGHLCYQLEEVPPLTGYQSFWYCSEYFAVLSDESDLVNEKIEWDGIPDTLVGTV